MEIDIDWDSSVDSAPAGFKTAVMTAVQYLDNLFTNPVTITIAVGYGEVAGQALPSGDLSASEAASDVVESYSAVRNALIAEGAPGASILPAASPDQGALIMPIAEAVGLGLSASNGTVDGYIGISSSYTFSYANGTAPPAGEFYLIGAVEHEITEDMGRVSFVDYQPNDYSAMDLFRYSSPGVRDLADGGSGSTAYFSIDNGTTNLGSWNNNSGNGDLGDWYPSGPAPGGDDAFNDYASPGVVNAMSPGDITLMEALGWTAATTDPGPTAGNGAITEGHGQTVTLTALIDGLITPGLAGDTETLTGVSAARGSAVLGSGQAVTYTAPAGGSDTISYTVADEYGDTAGGQVAVTVDPGPAAGNGAVTEGHGQTVTLTALIDGLITPGLAGDTETLTGVSAARGSAVLGSGQAVTYTAPASGPDTISYTVADEHGDTAGGQVAVTVDPGPAAGNGAVTEGHGLTVTLTALIDALITPGLAGDMENLTGVSAAHGSAMLGSGQAVTYTAPASGPDTISYTVADEHGDTAGGQVAVTVDPGPAAGNGAVTEGHGLTVTLTALIDALITPGLAGDMENLTGVSAAHGSAMLGSGQAVTYTAPASGPDTISYTVADEHGDTAGGQVAVTVDPGPTAGNGAVTEGHGETVTLTALIDALITPGLAGDMENLTGVSAAHGSAMLGSGQAVTYTAPASGPDTISYTVADEHGDTAGGQVAVTVDPGPTAGNGAVTEGHGETVTLTALIDGLVTPGLVGDTETLTGVSAAHGSAMLGSGQAVTYTAPASGPDTISYTVADEHGDTAGGQVAVTVDPDEYISSGGSAVGAVVGAGDFLIVSSGGYAQSTTVSSGGSVIVLSGGVVSSTTVGTGGAVTIVPGGAAVGTTIGSGGMQYVGSGGTADNSVIGGGTLELGVDASLGNDPTEFGAGSGTLRLDDTVMPSNTIGGFGSGDTIDLAGVAFGSGGTVTLLAGNMLQVTTDGGTYDLRLDPAQNLAEAQFTVSQDGGSGTDIAIASDTVSGGGIVYVSSGQIFGGVAVLSGGELVVLPGGAADGTVVSSGAIEMLLGSGRFAVISGTAQEYVLSGGTASGTVISSGGDEFVEVGGSTGGIVADGGSQVVYGTASGTVLNDFSYLYLESGTAVGTVVSSGVAVVYGSAAGTTDYGGGFDFVFAGGAATDTVLSGGEEYVETGATATGTVVAGGGAQVVYGTVAGTVLDSSTSAYFEPGSIAGGVTVNGALAVIYGAVSGTTVEGGGYDYVEPGGTIFGTVLNGGVEYVESGAAANGTVIDSGAEVIYGTTTGTVIDGGSYEYVYPGGTASGTIVNSGVESIFTLAIGTVVNSGGEDFVNDGSASGTIVAGGDELVEFATSAVGTLVSGAGGGQFVYGTAIDTTLASGGEEVVELGGAAGATAVDSGGYEYVASGGTAAGATIGGGTVELTSGASDAGIITFAGGGELRLDDAPGFAGTVAGFGPSDQIDLADISFSAGTIFGFQEAGTGTSGTLTVGDGTNTAALTLLGQYLASQFAIAGDGNGGTLVTDPPVIATAASDPLSLAPSRHT